MVCFSFSSAGLAPMMLSSELRVLHRLHGGFVVVDRGHQNHRGVGRDLVRVAQDFDPIDARHLDVGNNHVEQRAVDLAFGQFAGSDGFHLVAIAAQGNVEQFADRALVVADENLTHAFLLPRLPAQLQRMPKRRKFRLRRRAPAAATASRSWRLCRLPTAPTPCLRAPERSGTR